MIFRKIKKGYYIFIRNYIKYLKDIIIFSTKNKRKLKIKNIKIMTWDNTPETNFNYHYIYHTAWAARKLKKINPKIHIDIGSSLYFSGIVSTYHKIKFYDYRPAKLKLSNLNSKHADLTNLHFKDNSIESLSCMHVIEHIGLGRYGDPINPNDDLKAISEIKRVIKNKGNLLFVVPIGKPKIVFNAHRIYSYKNIIKYFHEDFELKEFKLITDNGEFINNPKTNIINKQNFGCGCFYFKKK